MIVLIPMGGFGTRFTEAGYEKNKPCIPTYDRHTGLKIPMVVAAMKDIPGIDAADTKIICVNRNFHAHDGTEEAIREVFPNVVFIHDHVLLDQAFACLLAREYLQNDEELIIGSCDNGMVMDLEKFAQKRQSNDVLMISHSGDQNIAQNPNAHSWAKLSKCGNLIDYVSIKQTVSKDYMRDHATTGMFWFKRSSDFLKNLELMLSDGDDITERKVLDGVLNYCIESGAKTSFIDVRYVCWGTPADYENYQKTFLYWREFTDDSKWL